MAYTEAGRASDKQLFHDWDNKVPGSKAPCDVVIAAVQSMHNRGYDVTEAEKFMEEGLKASEEKDGAAIQVATAKIFHALNEAPKDPASPYWNYNTYRTFADAEKEADFGPAAPYDVFSDDFAKKVTAGWMGQLIGGCLGTQIDIENKTYGICRETGKLIPAERLRAVSYTHLTETGQQIGKKDAVQGVGGKKISQPCQ